MLNEAKVHHQLHVLSLGQLIINQFVKHCNLIKFCSKCLEQHHVCGLSNRLCWLIPIDDGGPRVDCGLDACPRTYPSRERLVHVWVTAPHRRASHRPDFLLCLLDKGLSLLILCW